MNAAYQRLFADRLALQMNTYTWYRYRLLAPFLIRGPINTLNIGTGGGLETLRMLRRGNTVTTLEIDADAANRTRQRIERNGFAAQHTGLVGHVLQVDLNQKFHQVVMCEVLEHIQDDTATIARLSNWLLPGGRLILSTPTASYGMLPGDALSIREDGGHVRVGYDGPELDEKLSAAGFITLRRIYNGNSCVRAHLYCERMLRSHGWLQPLAAAYALASRPLMPALDSICRQPLDQITLAVKRS